MSKRCDGCRRLGCAGLALLTMLGAARVTRAGTSRQGFESWAEFDSPGGNRHLEAYVKNGWLGSKPPYLWPEAVNFQMGPARLVRRQGTPGKEVVGGQYALGVETKTKPVNVLTGVGGLCARPRMRWRLSAWLRGKGTVRFRVYEYSKQNRAVGISFFYTGEATPEWKRHDALFEPVSPETVRWGLVLEIGAGATVDVDEVSIGAADQQRIVYPRGVPKPVADTEKVAVAFPATTPIHVDGMLNERDWQRAEWHAGFLRHKDQSRLAGAQAQFAFLFDHKHLYLAFVTPEKAPSSDKLEPTAPGAWPRGNPVELFIDPGATRDVYHQLAVNVLGCTYESRIKDPSWDCAWKAKGSAEADRWCVEAAIPFAGFGRPTPQPGELWSVNVCRNGPYMGPWSPVGIQYHSPEGFGLLTFGTYSQWWHKGVSLQAAQQQRALTQAVRTMPQPDARLVHQLGDARRTLQALSARADKGAKRPMDRAQFLGLFLGAKRVQRTQSNVADDLKWIRAIQRTQAAR